jgi:hypothetical protein
MMAGGSDLKMCLSNLHQFHNHIMLLYPKLIPPEFKESVIEENSISIHYFLKRVRLKDFYTGFCLGKAK